VAQAVTDPVEDRLMTDIDTQVLPLAQRQHGLFTYHQVLAGGATPRMIRRRLDAGLWERRSRVVLGLAGSVRTVQQEVMAACLHVDGGIASHRAGAFLHRAAELGDPIVEVTVPYGGATRNPFGRVHRSVDLTSHDIVTVDGIPVTSLARTAADLFTCLRLRRAVWVVEGLLGSGRVTIAELSDVHGRYARQGRPGTVDVRELLLRLDEAPPLHSELERRTRSLLVDAGLAEPGRQIPLPGWVEHPAHVDFAYAEHRVIIEVDGRSWHSRHSEFELDRRRDNAAQLAGWIVLRFTWRQVTQDPDYVVSTIGAALRRRSAAAA
jgi:hypothetical protein